MKQRRKLDKLVVAFPDYGIPHHLQHNVGHPVDKELMILHVLATLVPIALPFLCAFLWQIDKCEPLPHVLFEIVPYRNYQFWLPINCETHLAIDH
jgi:hypothetical protein